MNWQDYLTRWQEVAEEQGFNSATLLEVDGYPILVSSKGDTSKPTIYLSSGVHGDEPSGPQALLGLLEEGYFDQDFHWLICPCLNPTGLTAGTRENGEGIDLNRDYRQCRSREVCSHIEWLKQQKRPDLFLSLHEDWESSGFYYYEINLGTGGATHQEILNAASCEFPPEPELVIDDHKVTEPGWIFHPEHPDIPEGWPEAIYLANMGCPLSLTFETPSSQPLKKRVACHQAVVREAVHRLNR